MTKKQILNQFIDSHKETVLEMLKQQGDIPPFISILSKPKKGKPKVSCLEIPLELFEKEIEGKDFVRDVILERFKDKVKSDGDELLCINFSGTAEMYKIDKKDRKKFFKNPKKFKQMEVILMTFDSKNSHSSFTYEVKRNMSVSVNGLEEDVNTELILIPNNDEYEIGGIFSNLF